MERLPRRGAAVQQCVRQTVAYERPRDPVRKGVQPDRPPDPPARGPVRRHWRRSPRRPDHPRQAGAIAAARLQLPTVAPGIGPPPDLNRWKMAAVGYPLWLWADGPTHVGPVSDSVAGLSVSLEASVTSLTFPNG